MRKSRTEKLLESPAATALFEELATRNIYTPSVERHIGDFAQPPASCPCDVCSWRRLHVLKLMGQRAQLDS